MVRIILMVIGLAVFLVITGVWAFAITDGLGAIGPAGLGAILAFVIGAGLLIAIFILIARLSRDRDDGGL